MRTLLIFIFFSAALFSFEIRLNQTFAKEVMPNEALFNVSIVVHAKSAEEAMQKLREYDEFVRTFTKPHISGGTFNSYPHYVYENKKRILKGYKGSIGYTVRDTDKESIKEFISKLGAKAKNDYTELSVNARDWQIDKKTYKTTKAQLRLDAIAWAKHYAKRIVAEKIAEQCDVKLIDFIKRISYDPYMRYEDAPVAAAATTYAKSVPVPHKERKSIAVDADFIFECE